MDGHFVERDGEQYLQLDHFDLDIAMDDFQFYATGIFPDADLSECDLCVLEVAFRTLSLITSVSLLIYSYHTDRMAVQFMNQYWRFVYQEILPETKNVWEPMLVKESNAFLASMPLKTMLYYGEQEDA